MNGCDTVVTKKPLFLEGVNLPSSYYEPPDPYSNYTPFLRFNLPAFARYAASIGKDMSDVTKDEFDVFVALQKPV
jgi:hypothetical protein